MLREAMEKKGIDLIATGADALRAREGQTANQNGRVYLECRCASGDASQLCVTSIPGSCPHKPRP